MLQKDCFQCLNCVQQESDDKYVCAATRRFIATDYHACALFVDKNSPLCDCCGKVAIPIGSGTIVPSENGAYALVCDTCAANLYTCGTCAHSGTCAADAYNGPLEKVVMKVFTQQTPMGVIQQQVQVLNPEVTAICCPDCKCAITSYKNFICHKQQSSDLQHMCEHWTLNTNN